MRVDIIGGGVAGLSLGIYLQKSGVDTTVYERHAAPGGLCTGWSRGDYSFNGCMHWLLGSQPGISFHTFWREVVDVDSLRFVYPHERVLIELPIADTNGCHVFRFLNDIDEFEAYLLSIAPEDARAVRRWTNMVRFVMPYLDYLPPVLIDEPWWRALWRRVKLARLLPMVPFMLRWARYSNVDFAQRFRNPFLRMAVERLYDSPLRMTVLTFAQAYAAKRVAGYPIGGSLAFAQMLADEYVRCGGTLRLSTPVQSVRVDGGQAVGLRLANGECTEADYVASAADWHWTVFDALEGKWCTKRMKQLRVPSADEVFYSFCMLFVGVAADMSQYPHFVRYSVPAFRSPDGTEYSAIEAHVYNYDPTLAPDGKCTVAVNFHTREGKYWIDLRRTDIAEYRRQKEAFAAKVLQMLKQRMGEPFASAVEVTDLTTPATYHRYTANYGGSSQGWAPLNNILRPFGVTPQLPGLRNFVMAGHWLQAGGGLPVALHTARCAAWRICKQMGIPFKATTNI